MSVIKTKENQELIFTWAYGNVVELKKFTNYSDYPKKNRKRSSSREMRQLRMSKASKSGDDLARWGTRRQSWAVNDWGSKHSGLLFLRSWWRGINQAVRSAAQQRKLGKKSTHMRILDSAQQPSIKNGITQWPTEKPSKSWCQTP